jgi:malate dehydrogenase (oxaloacetate-decarboxylating)
MHPSASFSATMRVRLVDSPGSFGRLASAIGEAGGSLGAIDLVRVEQDAKIRDVTVEAGNERHIQQIVEAVRAVPGAQLRRQALRHRRRRLPPNRQRS